MCNLDNCPKSTKIAALFEDDFKAPLYNVWRFSKSSNLVQVGALPQLKFISFMTTLLDEPTAASAMYRPTCS